MEYTWEAWVHPANGGDDELISGKTVFTGGIENADKDMRKVNAAIVRILKKRGSIRTDDYHIVNFS